MGRYRYVKQEGPTCVWACLSSVAGVRLEEVLERVTDQTYCHEVLAQAWARHGLVLIPYPVTALVCTPGTYLSIIPSQGSTAHAQLVSWDGDTGEIETWDPATGELGDDWPPLGTCYRVLTLDEDPLAWHKAGAQL